MTRMAKSSDESHPSKPAVKTSGVSKAAKPAAGSDAAPAPEVKKPKITAVEARKKLKGGKKDASSFPDGASSGSPEGAGETVGGKPRKKPVPSLNLPKDLSKQAGIQADEEAVAPAPERPKRNINEAIHTTNRDAQENRKVRVLLVAGVLITVVILGALVFLQLRDPAASTAAALTAREMAHYRDVLPQLDRAKIRPDVKGNLTVSGINLALSDLLMAKLSAATGGKVDPQTLPGNPELYSLYLAAQFRDGYEQPIRVNLVGGKVVLRSAGADKIDQTGGDSATATADDLVVSE